MLRLYKYLIKVKDPDYVGCVYKKGIALGKLSRVDEASQFKHRAQQIVPKYDGGLISMKPA